MTSAILAGSQPTAPTLVSACGIHHQSRDQSCRATRRSLVHTDARAHAWRKTVRRNPSAPAFSSPSSRQNPHSARCSAAPHLPRFRALALFRRRPQLRVDSFVIPASENLHNSGLGRCDHLIDFAPYGKCRADQAISFALHARGLSDDAAWQELSGRRRSRDKGWPRSRPCGPLR